MCVCVCVCVCVCGGGGGVDAGIYAGLHTVTRGDSWVTQIIGYILPSRFADDGDGGRQTNGVPRRTSALRATASACRERRPMQR